MATKHDGQVVSCKKGFFFYLFRDSFKFKFIKMSLLNVCKIGSSCHGGGRH